MSTLTHTQEAVPAGAWSVDPVHSQVGFSIGYATGTFHGTFAPFEARLEADDDGNAALTGEARADSVHVLDENLNAHLLSPEFFDAERTPVLGFRSTAIRRSGSRIEAAGELTIRGVSVPVELVGAITDPFLHVSGTERLTLRLETTVDRRAFGIDWNMELPDGGPVLANDVAVRADLFLVKE